jgi:hypothetical protein
MGTTNPVNTQGIDNDAYLNTTTGDVFLRQGGVYMPLGNLRGPQGFQGIQGVRGTDGTNGTNGAAGTNGTNGTNGLGFRAPSTVAYAATLTLNCATAETFYIAPLAGNLTLNLTGAVDGQKILVSIPQDATGNRQLTLGSMVAYSLDIPSVVLSLSANKEDVLGFQYRATTGKYRLISYTKGF